MKSNYRDQVQANGIGWYRATWMRPGNIPSSVIFRFTEYKQNVRVIPVSLTKTDPVLANIDELFGVDAITKDMKSLTK